ncbi:MAG: TatD family hydrolase [Bacteroidales bacterium]|nr:TatD family hydrolase [Bacteroidales bacterium]
MFVDIHTHVDNQAVIKIIDGDSEKILKTWGVHPWDVTDTPDRHFERNEVKSRNHRYLNDSEIFRGGDFSIPLRSSRNDELFIGEVGLDKVHKETFERQIEVFEEMIRLSESYRKPVIVHCVRAYSEIIEVRKKMKATMPWVIHGFNSSVETMRQLLRYDMYISLGEVLYRNENQAFKILKNIPTDRLFLETDVSGRDIRDVYAKAAALMGCEVEFLENKIFENYGRLEAAH